MFPIGLCHFIVLCFYGQFCQSLPLKKLFTISFLLIIGQQLSAQNTYKALITDDKTHEPLPGASLRFPSLNLGSSAGKAGYLSVDQIPDGDFELVISFIGYRSQEKKVHFPLKTPSLIAAFSLEPAAGELTEVVVQTTRTNQNIRDIPTRIEALPLEEIDEKSSMKPGDIKMLLGEVTGINVQQTSAVSGTANFRIQGLDSRYTQLLKDGMPLYQGFSSGLSLLQISPLDLKQVEFIKGSASTLYGGGAIAGLINLISKTPENTPELTVLLNGTSARGTDASAFYAARAKHIGTTVYGAYNFNGAYDPAHTGFTAIPLTHRFTLNPKIFLDQNARNTGWFGINTTYEDRYGGDLQVISGMANSTHQYFERNKSFRLSTQFSFTHTIDSISRLTLKNTIGLFNRSIGSAGYNFSGKELSSFTELNYVRTGKRADWVTGASLNTDQFTSPAPGNNLNYHQRTLGIFGQNTYKATGWFSVESGIRVDVNDPASAGKNLFLLPRVNTLFKIGKKLTSRIGGGLGYKMPGLFNDQTEELGYQHIISFKQQDIHAEQSFGLNADLNFRSVLGDAFITINELFFQTVVQHPLFLENNTFISSAGHIRTRGAETNAKLSLDELAFYLGYTYTDTRLTDGGKTSEQPLTARHRINMDAIYELENKFRIGAEAYYTSPQLLNDGRTGKGFITAGLLVQKMWKHLDIFLNVENLTDRRQSRWESIYTGTITSPIFKDIYTPIEGVVMNLGLRIKLLN